MNKKKDYSASQLKTLQRNIRNKDKQLKPLQMPAREQIQNDLRNTAAPVLLSIAKGNVKIILMEIY